MSYVYIQSESAAETAGGWPLWTVGAYAPDGRWHPDSDHGGETGREDAAARVSYLNGDHVPDPRVLADLNVRVAVLENFVTRIVDVLHKAAVKPAAGMKR